MYPFRWMAREKPEKPVLMDGEAEKSFLRTLPRFTRFANLPCCLLLLFVPPRRNTQKRLKSISHWLWLGDSRLDLCPPTSACCLFLYLLIHFYFYSYFSFLKVVRWFPKSTLIYFFSLESLSLARWLTVFVPICCIYFFSSLSHYWRKKKYLKIFKPHRNAI